eukprot:COSAG02_NODE_2873_length_7852_cov_41.208177_1_plen_76_part_00
MLGLARARAASLPRSRRLRRQIVAVHPRLQISSSYRYIHSYSGARQASLERDSYTSHDVAYFPPASTVVPDSSRR